MILFHMRFSAVESVNCSSEGKYQSEFFYRGRFYESEFICSIISYAPIDNSRIELWNNVKNNEWSNAVRDWVVAVAPNYTDNHQRRFN